MRQSYRTSFSQIVEKNMKFGSLWKLYNVRLSRGNNFMIYKLSGIKKMVNIPSKP